MKDKIISVGFLLIIFGFLLLGVIIKDEDISYSERRRLKTFNSLKEDFIGNIDDYLNDQAPFRNTFIKINSFFDRYFLGNKENNDVYFYDGYIIEKNYPLKKQNVDNFVKKLNYINENYLENCQRFYTIIPDKSYFLDNNKYLKMDYEYIISTLKDNIDMPYIDVTSKFLLEDYYKTDIHLKQPTYFKMIEELDKYLAFDYQEVLYDENYYPEFNGSSIFKVPFFTKPDEMIYLTNDIIEEALVWHLEYQNKKVYDLDKINGMDSYNVFLSGPSALIKIDNKQALSNKELIIFRDSFASSLTPLLIPYYKKITLIDLRYIKMDIVKDYVDFNNKDVLFMYSTLLVNESNILKVQLDN